MFNAELTRALQESGITQEKLSEMVESTQPELSRIARGARRVGPELLRRIIYALPVQFRAPLLRAWLNDKREEFGEVGEEIKVTIRGERTKSDPLAGLDPERRGIVEWTIRGVCDPKLLPMFRALWRQLEGVTAEDKSRTARKGRRKS